MISGNDIFRLYGGKIDAINVPLEMIEDYARLYSSLTFDWPGFELLMNEEARKSKIYSIYNRTIKNNQKIEQHPIDQIADAIHISPFSSSKTVDEPYKYNSQQMLSAKVQLILQENEKKLVSTVESVHENQYYYLLLDRTNFYSTAGGQSSDYGTIHFSDHLKFQVELVKSMSYFSQ